MPLTRGGGIIKENHKSVCLSVVITQKVDDEILFGRVYDVERTE